MKCFNHVGIDAVGLCKYCCKGLCTDCAVEIGKSLACKLTCQEDVAVLDAMIHKSIVTSNTQKKNRMFMPLFFVATGSSILALSYYRTGTLGLASIMGFVFIGFGIINYAINRMWVKDMETKR